MDRKIVFSLSRVILLFLVIVYEIFSTSTWESHNFARANDGKNFDRKTSRSKRFLNHPWFIDPCESEECFQVANIMLRTVNDSLEPCDDFYKFVCGNERNFERKYGHGREIITIDAHRKAVVKEFEDILNQMPRWDREEMDSLRIEREIYNACKSHGVRTTNDFIEYTKLLARTGAYVIFQHENDYRYSNPKWQGVDLKYALLGFGFSMFDLDVVDHPLYPDQRIIAISPPSDTNITNEMLDFLRRKQEDEKRIHPKNFNIFRDFLGLKLFLRKLSRIIQEIVPTDDFDYDINTDHEYFRSEDCTSEYNIMTVDQWRIKFNVNQERHNAKIDWLYILNEMFAKVYLIVDASDEIIIYKRSYFHKLSRIIKATPNDVIVDYIHLRFITKTIGYVEEEYVPSVLPAMKGWDVCNPGLSVGIAYEYLLKRFPLPQKETVVGVYDHLKNYFRIELRSYDEVTEQFNRSHVVTGYPSWMTNWSVVSNFYGRFSVSSINLINQLNMIDTVLKKKLSSLRDQRYPTFTKQNFFDFTLHEIEVTQDLRGIIIPAAGMINPENKFFSSRLPLTFNYGSIGVEVAAKIYYELLRQRGNNKRINIADCVVEQIPDRIGFGKWTPRRAAAAAYLLGLRASFWAMPGKDADPIQMPEFGVYTNLRLFFITFAQALCLDERVLNSNDARIFVNFAVSNLDEFSDSFMCFKNHSMNRYKKCNPWASEHFY